jgi:hypothetical protein
MDTQKGYNIANFVHHFVVAFFSVNFFTVFPTVLKSAENSASFDTLTKIGSCLS